MKKVLKVIGIVIGGLLALLAVILLVLGVKARTSFRNLERIDGQGTFYALEYTGNYESPLVSKTLNLFSGGCSAFIARDAEGDIITCRNYDFPHLDNEGNPSGLNVLVKCSPKNGYSSIGIADVGLFSVIGLPYYAGVLDSGRVSLIPLMFAPYLCMDGMNEKGVSVSILALDLKDGESAMHQRVKGRQNLMINAVLRQILDNCATLDEAVELVEDSNVICTFGYDYHLFVTDATGSSAVFEWRYNDFTVTYTDAVTNFYVGYDDACDCYYGDNLKEKFVMAQECSRPYRYGYGHGFERFNTVVETLEHFRKQGKENPAMMSDDEAMALLEKVSQDYDPEDSMTSLTQYSVIYNNTDLSVSVCANRDYDETYRFEMPRN